jgi:hypothetical protein
VRKASAALTHCVTSSKPECHKILLFNNFARLEIISNRTNLHHLRAQQLTRSRDFKFIRFESSAMLGASIHNTSVRSLAIQQHMNQGADSDPSKAELEIQGHTTCHCPAPSMARISWNLAEVVGQIEPCQTPAWIHKIRKGIGAGCGTVYYHVYRDNAMCESYAARFCSHQTPFTLKVLSHISVFAMRCRKSVRS